MLWLGSWIVFIGFWVYALKLAILDSRWLAATFISAWIVARVGFAELGIEGPIYFISFTALLTGVMIFIDLYRHNMGLRKSSQSPVDSINIED